MTTHIPTSRGLPWPESPSPDRPIADRAVPGTVVGGRYSLRTPIGHGGMGTVWRGSDSLLRREVAVKEVLLPPQMPPDERHALCERTMREARAAAALSHPSVVQVYDVVTDSGRPWIVMELLEARSLADMVIEDGPLAGRAVAKIGIAMLGALEVAHAVGVLHRDVKPANVLICTDGRCVLTDFGVARLPQESNLTTPGMVLGSPHFISPERAVGGKFGPPSDLFSLGVTLYTAVEGGPPFDKTDPFETMRAVVEEPPRPVRLAGPLTPVLWGLLEKDPARRWTVNQARSVLRELMAGPLSRSSKTHPDTDPYAVVRPPAGPPPAVTPPEQIGGRAMIAPGESLTGHLARMQGPPGGAAPNGHAPGPAGPPPPQGPRAPLGQPHGAGGRGPMGQPGHDATGGWQDAHPHGAPSRDAAVPPWDAAPPAGRRSAGRRRAHQPSMMSDIAVGARSIGRRIQQAPTKIRIAAAAGIVALAVAGTLVLSGALSGSDGAGAASGPTPGTSAGAKPLYSGVRKHSAGGVTLNVPKDWKKSEGKSYVDYIDPDGGGVRKVRILIEPAGGDSGDFFKVAEAKLKENQDCPAYQRVNLGDAKVGDRDGTALEYTCAEGGAMRHGLWSAVVAGGKAFSFYLTVPEAEVADSKVIYREMVRSFTLAAS